MPRLKKENGRSGQHRSQTPRPFSFDHILKRTVEENAPAECYTVTYNASSQLQTYYYRQSREYTY